VLAEAVQSLCRAPSHHRPVIENGFYYDFFRNEPFTPEDFAAIEKRCARSSRATNLHRDVWTARRQNRCSATRASLQGRAGRRIPGDEPIKIYFQGDWFDLCRGRI